MLFYAMLFYVCVPPRSASGPAALGPRRDVVYDYNRVCIYIYTYVYTYTHT